MLIFVHLSFLLALGIPVLQKCSLHHFKYCLVYRKNCNTLKLGMDGLRLMDYHGFSQMYVICRYIILPQNVIPAWLQTKFTP